jgi:hypothetical protein
MSTTGPGYFRTVGTPVLSGREFIETDTMSTMPVALVNQEFASQQWPGENALGKRFRIFRGKAPSPWLTVVGVVSTIAQVDPLRRENNALVYLPYTQQGRASLWLIARSRVPSGALTKAIQRELQAIDPVLPIQIGPSSIRERLADRYQYRGVSGALFVICAGIALLLASIGLYAVIAHSVSQRTQEIGIRMAIGGTARDILALVLRQGLVPVGIGLLIGLGASLALVPLVESTLVQVSPTDPVTFALASLALVLAAVLGCLVPARRAMQVDPVVALRDE